MIDQRIYTFLKLCEVMSYRKTAEILNMTQPAVTQHIKYLENIYSCKLFNYEAKVLSKTDKAVKLEEYSRAVLYNEQSFKKEINLQEKRKISIGATKTIGDFIINQIILNLLGDDSVELELIVDNTKNLFDKLNTLDLDFLMIEGYFDKSKYAYKPIKDEELVGVCALDHKFANKTVSINDIFKEHIILREKGSGTRDVLEHFLREKNNSFAEFRKISTISSFNLILEAVRNNIAISFVYKSIAMKNKNLAVFKIENSKISHELNYVFLKNTKVLDFIDYIEDKKLNI